MAEFRTATVAAALFCLFAFSIARAPPRTDESTVSASITLAEADPALRLPTEPVKTEADAKANTETDSDSAVVSSVPLTDISFRPVNRRFRVRSKYPCRHHFKFHPTMRENKPIPYGNDMILVSGENSDFEQPIFRGGGKRIPGRWMRMRHHHHHQHQFNRRIDEDTDSDSDDEENVDRVKRVVLKRHNYDRFEREKKLKKLREHFRARIAEQEKKPKKGSFMKGVRKFLDRYI